MAFIEQPHHTYHQVLIPDTMVSRRHAVISFRNARYYLKDLGSSNGTMVNDARVRPDEEVEVGHGTVVQVVELEQKQDSKLLTGVKSPD